MLERPAHTLYDMTGLIDSIAFYLHLSCALAIATLLTLFVVSFRFMRLLYNIDHEVGRVHWHAERYIRLNHGQRALRPSYETESEPSDDDDDIV